MPARRAARRAEVAESRANALALAGTVIFPASFPKTRARLESRGFQVTPLDISELQKAESGLTCSSLIFSV